VIFKDGTLVASTILSSRFQENQSVVSECLKSKRKETQTAGKNKPASAFVGRGLRLSEESAIASSRKED
jgi:hypothetical protein